MTPYPLGPRTFDALVRLGYVQPDPSDPDLGTTPAGPVHRVKPLPPPPPRERTHPPRHRSTRRKSHTP